MNSLFGVELPTPVNFVIAFIVVLVLIGAATWLVRRFGASRLDAAGRSRQPRLAVVDATAIDGRRKLVIIRRDNAEHLLMIGGPTDVVVETNIMRSGSAVARDTTAARTGAGEVPRAMPLPDPTPWPLQPEPVAAPAAPAPVVRLEPPPPRIDIDDLSPRPTPAEPFTAPPAVARPRQAETLAGLAAELARPSPEVVAIPRPSRPEPARMAPPQPVAAAPVESRAAPADQNLAEMAQRLEAALRRPVGQSPSVATAPDGGARPHAAPDLRTAPRAEPAGAGAKTEQQPRQLKNIEKEMASLLGRPSKT
jgi:flagellar protein FliO/FliZ